MACTDPEQEIIDGKCQCKNENYPDNQGKCLDTCEGLIWTQYGVCVSDFDQLEDFNFSQTNIFCKKNEFFDFQTKKDCKTTLGENELAFESPEFGLSSIDEEGCKEQGAYIDKANRRCATDCPPGMFKEVEIKECVSSCKPGNLAVENQEEYCHSKCPENTFQTTKEPKCLQLCPPE